MNEFRAGLLRQSEFERMQFDVALGLPGCLEVRGWKVDASWEALMAFVRGSFTHEVMLGVGVDMCVTGLQTRIDALAHSLVRNRRAALRFVEEANEDQGAQAWSANGADCVIQVVRLYRGREVEVAGEITPLPFQAPSWMSMRTP